MVGTAYYFMLFAAEDAQPCWTGSESAAVAVLCA